MQKYPLDLRFKILAFTPQVYIKDTEGKDLFFVYQKFFKLREDIQVFSDSGKQSEIFRIKADRIIDFSAKYNFFESKGEKALGSVKRKGFRSLWKATYIISSPDDRETHYIKEDNPWVKVFDALIGEIPFLGLLSGHLFHPSYTVYNSVSNQPVMQLVKQASFFEKSFKILNMGQGISESEETKLLLSLLMMVLLERGRG